MPLLGERVVPKHPLRGLYALTALAAAVWGLCVLGNNGPLFIFGFQPNVIVSNALVYGLPFLPPMIFLALLGMLLQRRRTLVRVGILLNVAAFAWIQVFGHLHALALGVGHTQVLLWPSLVLFVVAAGAGTINGIAVGWIMRTVVVRLIEQPEPIRFCWRCGYEFGIANSPNCTECGVRVNPVQVRARSVYAALRHLQRYARPALGVLIVFVVLLVVRAYVLEVVPVRAFLRRIGDSGAPINSYIDIVPKRFVGKSWSRYNRSIGRLLDHQDHAGRDYLISFSPSPSESLPAMQIRIAVPVPPPFPQAAERFMDAGTPTVVADLTRAQADRVIREGVPDGLLAEISKRADAIGWKPSGTFFIGLSRELVDPAPFFTDHAE